MIPTPADRPRPIHSRPSAAAARSLATVIALSAAASFAAGQATITPVGVLPGDDWSTAYALSGDGRVVLGASQGRYGFRWTIENGLDPLPALPGDNFVLPGGANHDGTVLSAASYSFSHGYTAAIWSRGGGIRPLGFLPGWLESIVGGITANGDAIVGYCIHHQNNLPTQRAFIWSVSQGMRDLGTLPGGTYSMAIGISQNGGYVCGGSAVPPNDYQVPIRWTPSGGMQPIGLGPCGEGSAAWGISGDGSAIVGDDYCPDLTTKGFRWRSGHGMDAINPPGNLTELHTGGTNRDGSLVVGYAYTPGVSDESPDAILWSESTGTMILRDLLAANGADVSGWALRNANAISLDGLIIVGDGDFNGQNIGWRAELPCPLLIGPAPTPPVCTYGTVEFTVDALGSASVTYQWRKDGVELEDGSHTSGARSRTLRLGLVTPANEGSYDCVVTGGCGSTISAATTLVVCSGDFNCDGGLDGGDVDSFFGAWSEGGEGADVNRDGGVDGSDVQEFFLRWEAGSC